MSDIVSEFRRVSGHTGPLEFLLHPDDVQHPVVQEALASGGATVVLDRKAPRGKLTLRPVEGQL